MGNDIACCASRERSPDELIKMRTRRPVEVMTPEDALRKDRDRKAAELAKAKLARERDISRKSQLEPDPENEPKPKDKAKEQEVESEDRGGLDMLKLKQALESWKERQVALSARETSSRLEAEKREADFQRKAKYLTLPRSDLTTPRGEVRPAEECRQCGNIYMSDALFCRKCGVKRPQVNEDTSTEVNCGPWPQA